MIFLVRKKAAIVGYGETPFSRARADKGEATLSAEQYYAWATELVLENTGLEKSDFDGEGLAVGGSEWPHSEIWSAEVAQNLGISPKLLIRSDHGGMSGVASLIQAVLAVHSGLVEKVLCVAADSPMSLQGPASRPWRYMIDFCRPFGMMGPNSMIAFILQRYLYQYGIKPEHTGKIAVTQRQHASMNPNAYLKTPMNMEDYLNSRMIVDPIRLLDCCILVNGGLAFVVASQKEAKKITDDPVHVLGIGEAHNYLHGSRTRPDVTVTGIKPAAKEAYKMAKVRTKDVCFIEPYDDYTIIVLQQLEDLGFCKKGEVGKFVDKTDLSTKGKLPVNTGGGQLSAGQAGMAGGFLHVIEAVRQLRGEGGQRQVPDADVGVVSGMGGLGYAVNLVNNGVVVFGK